jgi:stearoyl-CoA desaturase (delta-9 desaturase)
MSVIESGQLTRPGRVTTTRIAWPYLASILAYHLLACLAFLPFFFSWSAVIVAIAGVYVFGTLGINLCYHRLLTHQGFTCPRWLERCLAVLGICCAQEGPIRWVAVHRRHHQYSDEELDPHSPLVNFLWAHVGWLVVESRGLDRIGLYSRYARDLAQDRFYLRFDRMDWYLGTILLSWLLFFLAGFTAGWIAGGSAHEAAQLGASFLVWGVFVRTVVVWHVTWSVNSVTHLWGSQRYATGDGSRNNALVALISNGEGWHNNHHADQRSAKNSRFWWEVDVTYYTIRLLAALGLAKDVVLPNPRLAKPLERHSSTVSASGPNPRAH